MQKLSMPTWSQLMATFNLCFLLGFRDRLMFVLKPLGFQTNKRKNLDSYEVQ